MLPITSANRSVRLVAATAFAAAGLFALPLPAKAAPACEQWGWPGGGLFTAVAGNGSTTNMSTSNDYVVGRPISRPTANLGAEAMSGTGTGGFKGSDIDITINFDQGPGAPNTFHFTGKIDDDGLASGIVTSGVNKRQDSWSSTDKFFCVKQAAVPENQNPAKTFGTATVVADTDIYDKPDGLGQRIGTLFVGEEHPLMEPCRDDWCRVGQIELGGFPGLPNGTAWVYAKGFLTFS